MENGRRSCSAGDITARRPPLGPLPRKRGWRRTPPCGWHLPSAAGREVCGALSGVEMALGCLYGYDTPETGAVKKEHYARVQDLAARFRREFGSILCREILEGADASPNPTPRTEEFYEKRPCLRCVIRAAELLEEYIGEHSVSTEQEEEA